jgi:hypothetical protein
LTRKLAGHHIRVVGATPPKQHPPTTTTTTTTNQKEEEECIYKKGERNKIKNIYIYRSDVESKIFDKQLRHGPGDISNCIFHIHWIRGGHVFLSTSSLEFQFKNPHRPTLCCCWALSSSADRFRSTPLYQQLLLFLYRIYKCTYEKGRRRRRRRGRSFIGTM